MITLILLFSVLFSAETPDVSGSNVPADNAKLLAADNSFNKNDCTCKGIPLKGRVEVVNVGADFKVEVVNIGADLKVEVRTYGANKCGEWEFVNVGADFKVEFVNVGADFKIEYVNIAPGIR
jgi:hypothetical protein